MKLRRAFVTLPVVAAVMAIVGACGREAVVAGPGATTTPPPITHPTGAGEVVLRLEAGGGLVPVEQAFGNVLALTIYGDGAGCCPTQVLCGLPRPRICPD